MKAATISKVAFAMIVIVACLLALCVTNFVRSQNASTRAIEQERSSLRAAAAVGASSALLTDMVREYVATTQPVYLNRYWEEINTTKSQAKAIQVLKDNGTPESELALVQQASANSANLVKAETRAMRLVLEATGVPRATYPAAVAEWDFSAADQALSRQAKLAQANRLVFGASYDAEVARIMQPIDEFNTTLSARLANQVDEATGQQKRWTMLLAAMAVILMVGGVVVLAMFFTQVTAVLARYTRQLNDADPRDLTVTLAPAGALETRDVAVAFNARSQSVTEVIHAVRREADTLLHASASLAGVSRELGETARVTSRDSEGASTAADTVSRHIQTVAAGTEEMGLSIREISNAAHHASSVAAEAVGSAQAAGETVTKLGESSQLIGEVVKSIESIAAQTNLLALNATIEAARAGEAGKGFAVVATEVKELADQTARSTQDIGAKVSDIQRDALAAASVLAEISGVIARINETQTTIASAVEEQTATTQEMARTVQDAANGAMTIAGNVTDVARSSQRTSASADDAQTSAGNLAELAQQLKTSVAEFRV